MVVKYNIEIMLDNRGKNFVKYFGEKIAMNWEYFLIHTDIIKERGLDIGFKLYGAGHLIWLAAIIVCGMLCIAVLPKWTKFTER